MTNLIYMTYLYFHGSKTTHIMFMTSGIWHRVDSTAKCFCVKCVHSLHEIERNLFFVIKREFPIHRHCRQRRGAVQLL